MIPIEDYLEDVLPKAARGYGKLIDSIAHESRLTAEEVECVFIGKAENLEHLEKVAFCLNLSFSALKDLAATPTAPHVVLPPEVHLLNTPFPVPGYEEMTVNSYLVCPKNAEGIAISIDTGAKIKPLEAQLQESGRSLSHLFLTHLHRDHIAAYASIQEKQVKAYSPKAEPIEGCTAVRHGDSFQFGDVSLRALSTRGHSIGGTSYLLEGVGKSIAFVGDAIFCRSMGKANGQLREACEEVRKNILSLPEETILCPGHGPLTTVGFERVHNPFFA